MISNNKNILLAIAACLTLGLAPFTPEPHIVGKLRWIMGGGEGMQAVDYYDLIMHSLPFLFLIYLIFKQYNSTSNKVDIQTILQQDNIHIIDVREKHEYDAGHIDGAVFMPLSKFQEYIPQIQKMKGSKVLYCRSGNRSGQATAVLHEMGIKDAYNGGGYDLMQSNMITH